MRITENIKIHLPTINFADDKDPRIPEVSEDVAKLFHSIKPMENDGYTMDPEFRPLNHCVKDLQKALDNLKEAKSSAIKHKCLSILSLAALVAVVAALVVGAILFPIPPLAILGGFLAFALLAGIAGALLHLPITNFQYGASDEGPFDPGVSLLGGFASCLTLGLSLPIHAIYAVFTRVTNLESNVHSNAKAAQKNNIEMSDYILKNYDKLKQGSALHKEASETLERLKEFCGLQDKKPERPKTTYKDIGGAPPPKHPRFYANTR